MAPDNHVRRRGGKTSEVLMVGPGGGAMHMAIPPPPTMSEIREAFEENEAGADHDDDGYHDEGVAAQDVTEAAATQGQQECDNGQIAAAQANAATASSHSPRIQNPFETESGRQTSPSASPVTPQHQQYCYHNQQYQEREQQRQQQSHLQSSPQNPQQNYAQHSPHEHRPTINQLGQQNQQYAQQQFSPQHHNPTNQDPAQQLRHSTSFPSPSSYCATSSGTIRPQPSDHTCSSHESPSFAAADAVNGAARAVTSAPNGDGRFWSGPNHLSSAGAFHESFDLSSPPTVHDNHSSMQNVICNPFDDASAGIAGRSASVPTHEMQLPSLHHGDLPPHSKVPTTTATTDESDTKQSVAKARAHHERSPSVEEVMQASLEFRRCLSHPADAAAAIKDAVQPVELTTKAGSHPLSSKSASSSSPSYSPRHLYPSSDRVERAIRAAPFPFDAQSKKPAAKSQQPRRSNEATAIHQLDLLDDCKLQASGGSHVYEAFATSSLLDGNISAPTVATAEVDPMVAEDADLIAMKWAAYNGTSNARSATTSTYMDHAVPVFPEQEATVVAITDHDVHPSDMGAVRAELIGEDYNNITHQDATTTAAATHTAFAVEDASAIGTPTATVTEHDTATTAHTAFAADEPDSVFATGEATIIDRETDWQPPHEEAVVLPDDNTSFPYVDADERKPPAIPNANEQWVHTVSVAHTETSPAVAVSEGQAEVIGITEDYSPTQEAVVVGISEEFHPVEVEEDAQAELVGPDYNCTVAVPERNAQTAGVTTGLTPEAHAVVDASMATGEAQHTVHAAAVLNEDPCTPTVATARAYSTGAIGQEPIAHTARAVSAPAFVGVNPFDDDPHDTPAMSRDPLAALGAVVEEEQWMHAPSSVGELSCEPVIVSLQAPTAHATASPEITSPQQPAVVVASLDAYATSPAPPVESVNPCSVEEPEGGYPQQRPISAESAAVSEMADSENNEMPPRTVSEGGSVGSAATRGGGFQKLTSGLVRGMEMLFGDTGIQEIDNEKSIVPRTLLPWSVIYSEATNMWVATVNTNQKALDSNDVVEASKSLRAFSVMTQKQATCLAKAWSPPRRHSISDNPVCAMCKSKFALLRRACHCRNCGICVCNNCVIPWPSKMVPETYNRRKESFVNICKGCDWLCTNFRLSLLEGDRDKAIAIHATGNVNVVTPFANVKGELFYPVHCAALGGNLDLLKWLVEDNCCPIKSVRVSGRCRDAQNSFTEISTSKGRSLLGIALENRNVSIVRYLVVEKGIPLSAERDLNAETLSQNLDLVLRLLPEDASRGFGVAAMAQQHNNELNADLEIPMAVIAESQEVTRNDTGSDGSVHDACIICFENTINSVATPCGHQVCCLQCSSNITRCPVCAVECSFMRVFRP